ncbi:MAG: DUF2905 domain-containing protein [Verrucomicrobia bacterium]|nr:DUF2905 domain-containing protein [Verrucomicrobiota bacterium]MBV9671199.1 DUF2905 domain-containing protein [Verrucomicrobiota bacterium]
MELGKYILILGLIVAAIGFVLWRAPDLLSWFGRLPGDISIRKGGFSFYFPIASCILISLVLTLLGWLFRR